MSDLERLILDTLAAKDAEIERLTRERDEWKRVAGEYREQDRSQSDCDEHVDHQGCDERCTTCKAYDALVKGE